MVERKKLSLSSPAFLDGDKIPIKYTCQGQDVSPPLAWNEPPAGTQSFVLIVNDLGAPRGVFPHWIVFNVPPNSRELPESVPTQAQLPGGAIQGKNDFGRIGYGGPCPPPGRPHQYQFTLYALDRSLGLEPGAFRAQLVNAMQGHILAQSQLVGTYKR